MRLKRDILFDIPFFLQIMDECWCNGILLAGFTIVVVLFMCVFRCNNVFTSIFLVVDDQRLGVWLYW